MSALSGKNGPLSNTTLTCCRSTHIPEECSSLAKANLLRALRADPQESERGRHLGARFKIFGDRHTSSDLALSPRWLTRAAVALENARWKICAIKCAAWEMRDYLNSTLSSLTSGVVTLDRDTKITSVNHAAEVILGIQASSAIGMP
jgi:PAS domain-containing protein